MEAWMIFGPFDLSDAQDATLTFSYFNKSEANYDYFKWMASTDGTNFSGYQTSGDSQGWQYKTFDLTNVPNIGNTTGDSQVWIAFIFTSDGSNADLGAFVDDVVIEKEVGACDLAPYALDLDPDPGDYYWKSGCTSVRGIYVEENNGASTAVGHYSEIFLVSGSRRYSLATPHVPAIPAFSQSQQIIFDVNVPTSIPDGDYFIYADADMNGSIPESDESNNIAQYSSTDLASIRQTAELEWTSITTSSANWNWQPGDRRTISVTVENTGVAPAQPHSTRIVLSLDGITPAATLCDVRFVSGIPAGSSETVMSNEFTVPQLPAGRYRIGALVDIDGDVLECDNTNNGGYSEPTVNISGQEADLTITSLQANQAWVIGTSEMVTVNETNIGSGTAVDHTSYLYLSANAGSNEHFLKAETIASMAPGDSRPEQFSFQVPSTLSPGMYFLIAVADGDGAVNESNRSNNRYVYPMQISLARALAVTSPMSGDAWTAGTPQQIRWTSSGTQCVSIDYSVNNGSSWSVVVDSYTTSTGSYTWNVPDANSTQCRIRVRDCNNSAVSAESGTFTITRLQGRLALLHNIVNCGVVTLGQSSEQGYFTIRNDGSGALTIRDFIVSGTDRNDFRVKNTSPGPISPSSTVTVSIEFTPTGTAGAKSATLTFTSTDPANPQASVTLTGTAQAAGVNGIFIPVSYVNFGSVPNGNTESRDIIVTNSGTNSYTIYDQHLVGTDRGNFNFTPLPSNLAAGQNAVLQFTFTPRSDGSKDAEFRFKTTDPNNPEIVIYLSGNGILNGIDNPSAAVQSLTILPNYPNPFRSSTAIQFSISGSEQVTIRIHDATGKIVRTFDEGILEAGIHTRTFDAADLPTCIYSCTIETKHQQSIRLLHHIR
jgi:hypothetical protein